MSELPPAPTLQPLRRVGVVEDIYCGAVHGDWTEEHGIALGVAGHATQFVMGLIPGIQTLCAYRDFRACRRKRDRVGMALNGVALIPFLGMFPKTAAVLRSAKDIGDTAVTANNMRQSVGKSNSVPRT